MKTIFLKQMLATVFVLLGTSLTSIGQTSFHTQSVDVSLSGTSTLHDWVMKSGKGTSNATFVIDGADKFTSITKLVFSIPVNTLKSEHKAMDNNTYKAMNTTSYPDISFVGTSATISSLGNNNYQIKCTGKLSISGTTKETELIATGKYSAAEKILTITGVKKMKMTDFNVKPPTVMLGTIKTGDAISIAYNLKFVK